MDPNHKKMKIRPRPQKWAGVKVGRFDDLTKQEGQRKVFAIRDFRKIKNI